MRSILFSSVLIVSLFANAQRTPRPNVIAVLKETSKKLSSARSISYRYAREMRYYADNYHSQDSARMFIEFGQTNSVGLRFQAARPGVTYIYNGTQTIDLDETSGTIDTTTIRDARRLESNSFLYSSLATLRNLLPEIITNDSLVKTLGDTMIAGKRYYHITIEGAGIYFNSLRGLSRLTGPGMRRPYHLIIDPKTSLPYQYISVLVNGDDDRDFIKVIYTGLRLNPAAPASASWSYATYKGRYKPYVQPVEREVITKGAVVPGFKLPRFDAASPGDSLSSASMAGKIVLLDFWFKSCGPCMKAMPHYNDLQAEFGKDGFDLVTVNIEDPESDIAFFYNKYKPTYHMLYNGKALFDELGFDGCPSAVLVDRTGKVVETFQGFDQEKIEGMIRGLVDTSKGPGQ